MSNAYSTDLKRQPRSWFEAWSIDTREGAAIAKLATPIALVALVNMGMSITDTLMAASFGAEALAAVAVGSDFYSIVFYLIAGTIGGIAPFYAAAHAESEFAQLRRLRSIGWAIVVLGSVFAVPTIWFAPHYLSRFGLNEQLLADGADYTQWMALTLIPMAAVAGFRNRLTAVERAGLLLKITLSALPLNAALNFVLMHGIAGWSGLGVSGAGLSSLLVASFIASALFVLRDRDGGKGELSRIDWRALFSVLRVGLPIGATTLSEVGIFLGATLYAATLTVDDAAAHAVGIRLAGVTYAVSIALLQASMVRIARTESAGGLAARRTVIANSVVLAAIAGTCLLAMLLLGAEGLSRLVLGSSPGNQAAAALAAQLIVMLAIMEFIAPLGATASGLMRGRKDTKVTMVFSLVGNWAISAPLGLYLSAGLNLGIAGVWLGLTAGTLVTAVLTLWRLPIHWGPGSESRQSG